MNSVKVALAEKEYEISPLTIGKSRQWRKKLNGPFAALVGVLEQAPGIELSDLGGIASVITTVSDTFTSSPDLVADLLFEYSPELSADRERIEDEGFDEEIMSAFVEVLKLAYPFGELRKLIGGNGQVSRRTSKKSRSPSGASPKKS